MINAKTLPFFVFACLLFPANAALASSCLADGHAYGVVEIGGKGVKATIARLTAAPPDSAVACNLSILDELDPINSDPVVASHLDQTIEAIKEQRALINKWSSANATPVAKIYYVLSSGLRDLAKNGNPDDAGYFQRLKNAIADNTGERPGVISADDEASLTFDGVVNAGVCTRRSQVALIDIGSSNTKGAYLEFDPVQGRNCTSANYELQHRTFQIPWGTRGVDDKVWGATLEEQNYIETLEGDFLPKTIAAPLRKIVTPVESGGDGETGFQERERVYLAGGISYALATLAHPDNTADYVHLKASEIDAFYFDLRNNPDCVEKYLDPSFDRQDCRLKSRLAFASSDRKNEIDLILHKIFPTRNQLLAGAGLLKTVSDEWNFKNRRVCFARQAIHSWMLGYLLQKYGNATDLPREDAHDRIETSSERELGRC